MTGAHPRRLAALALPTVILAVRPPECAAAQRTAILPSYEDAGLAGVPRIPKGAEARHVRVSLDEHRLYVIEGDSVVWSATIGTGTGAMLEGAGGRWDFSTPPGRYRVQLKETNPVWLLPDWYFVERDEPIPPRASPQRRREGELGEAALYLTDEIAIHGTDHTELLGGEISHGCIRMSNADVLRLHEELEVGTLVVIH